MCVFTLEDCQGSVEVVVFPETFAQLPRRLSRTARCVLVRGKFERDEEIVAPPGAEILPLAPLRERLSRGGRDPVEGHLPARDDSRRCGSCCPSTAATGRWRSKWR